MMRQILDTVKLFILRDNGTEFCLILSSSSRFGFYDALNISGHYRRSLHVDPGGPVVIILASGSEVRGFDPGGCRRISLERKNPEYDFLRKGSKAVGLVS